MTPKERGEARHETCMYGRLTEAWIGGDPTILPLCMWSVPEPCPPALKRAWGGLVDYAKDCAVCRAWEDLPELQLTPGEARSIK